MASKFPGKCKGLKVDRTNAKAEPQTCLSAFDAGTVVMYSREAGGVVGCPACKPELSANAGVSVWTVQVESVKKLVADGSFMILTATVLQMQGPDEEQYRAHLSNNNAVEFGFGKKSVSKREQLDFTGPLGTAVRAGDHCEILGSLEDSKYGLQVKAISPAVLEIVEGDEGIIAFLKRLPFIGETRAKALVAHYGSGPELWEALENNPETIADNVRGITPLRAQKISEEYRHSAGLKEAYLALSGQKLSPRLIARALEEWHQSAPAILKDSVYCLLALDQSWADTDRIALAQGYAVDDERRLAAVAYRLAKTIEATGSTWASSEELLAAFVPGSTPDQRSPYYQLFTEAGLITVDKIEAMLKVGTTRGLVSSSVAPDGRLLKLAQSPLVIIEGAVFPANLAYAEREIASSIARLQQAEITPWQELSEEQLAAVCGEHSLSPGQLAAVEMARTQNISILTGSPGTGKSKVVETIVALCKANEGVVHLCAPTGKAAQVLTQFTGEQATTIHRMLAPTGVLDEDLNLQIWTNESVSSDPGSTALMHDLLVLDEFSFADVELTRMLLSKVRSGCRVLFVGDVDQLPSVGAGAVFRDLIEANKLPLTRLTKIFRTRDGSPIPHLAADIRDGVEPDYPTDTKAVLVLDVRGKAGAAAAVNQADAARWTAERAVWLATDVLPKRGAGGAKSGFDVTVIAAQRRGECGVETLNTKLQAALNPPVLSDNIFIGRGAVARPGDVVMQTKNNSMLLVFNGELGRVVATDKSGSVLSNPRFDFAQVFIPNATVINSNGRPVKLWKPTPEEQTKAESIKTVFASSEDSLVLVVEFPGIKRGTVRYIAYTRAEALKLDLGYAITTHKSQGSSFKCVVFCCPNAHAFGLTRANVYTAITRTSDYLALVGEPESIVAALSNVRDKARKTKLKDYLMLKLPDALSKVERREAIISQVDSEEMVTYSAVNEHHTEAQPHDPHGCAN